MTLIDKGLLCRVEVFQGIGRRQQRPDFISLDVPHQILEHPWQRNSRPGKGQIAKIKRTEIKLDHRTGNRTGTGIAATAHKSVNELRPK